MPLSGSLIAGQILLASPQLTGPVEIQLAQAIGNAVSTWAVDPSSVILVGVVSGVVGGGVVTGTKVVVPPVPIPVTGSLSAFFTGPVAAQLSTGVGVGVATAVTTSALYTGVSAGAIGADVSKIVFANPATLIAQLITQMAAVDIRGPAAQELASGLGLGIATMFLTGVGVGVAVGAAGPSPGVGVSKCNLV